MMTNKQLILLTALVLLVGIAVNIINKPAKLSLETSIKLSTPVKISPMPDALKTLQQQSPGQWQIAFLGYTSCPDICPTTLMELAQIIPSLNEQAPVSVIFISADPKRDSQEKAQQYARYFNPSFNPLVLEEPELSAFAAQLKLDYRTEPADVSAVEEYEVIHSAALALISPSGEVVALIEPEISDENLVTFNQAALVADFAQLVAE